MPLTICCALMCLICSANAQPYCLAEQESALESRHYRYDTHWICTGDTLEIFSCEDGTFYLVDGFWITCNEVTQDLFEWYMGFNPSDMKGDLYPVTNINVDEAYSFCEKISETTRLSWTIPTESQWQFAFKGGLFSEGYRYSGSDRLDLVAWTTVNSSNELHVGGQRISNELGLFDMSGNVAEMVVCDDTVRYAGGCYQFSPSEFDNSPQHPIPANCRGLRIICHQPLWFNTYEEMIHESSVNALKNKQ